MTAENGMEADAPIDVGRMSRPEADAFRYIAQALGAKFAGDLPDVHDPDPLAGLSTEVLTHPWEKPRGSMLDVAPADPKASALLERMPIACLVIVNDDVAFINRASVVLFGYTSANILEAAGGIGALFVSGGPERTGTMTLRTASGRTFAAKVSMASIDWADDKAMLLTAMPADAAARDIAPRAAPSRLGRDPTVAVLDANPDPIVLISRGGHVEMCNRAFETLGAPDRPVRLEDRIGASDLQHVFDVMNLAFMLADGQPRETRPMAMAGDIYTVSVGAMRDERVACLVFHKVAADAAEALRAALAEPDTPPLIDRREIAAGRDAASATTGETEPPAVATDEYAAGEIRTGEAETEHEADAGEKAQSRQEPEAGQQPEQAEQDAPSGTALFRAVHAVRRLVPDTALMIVSEAEERAGAAGGFVDASEAELLRLILLTIATRGDPRAVLKVRREGDRIVVMAPSAPERALERVAESNRIADIASEACRSVSVSMRGSVTIEPAQTGEASPGKAVDLVR